MCIDFRGDSPANEDKIAATLLPPLRAGRPGHPRRARLPAAAARKEESELMLLVKLLASGAVVCGALGYAARFRAPWAHRRLMAAAIALATLAPLPVLAGFVLERPPALPAWWLSGLFGSPAGARWSGWLHQGLSGVLLALMWTQGALGLLRSPWHRPTAGAVLALAVPAYLGTMFLYY